MTYPPTLFKAEIRGTNGNDADGAATLLGCNDLSRPAHGHALRLRLETALSVAEQKSDLAKDLCRAA